MTRIGAAWRPNLPALRSDVWEPTRTTLHLWVQIVGKVKLATTAPRNHWWNVPLYLDVRGLTTRRLHHAQVSFQIDFDFVDHRLLVRTNRGQQGSFRLHEGLSVARFDRLRLHWRWRELGSLHGDGPGSDGLDLEELRSAADLGGAGILLGCVDEAVCSVRAESEHMKVSACIVADDLGERAVASKVHDHIPVAAE